jgi:exonuclease SbcD
MDLAAPMTGSPGELLPHGRLYLATEPTLLRLRDRQTGHDVQFVLMPYPTPTRYLRDAQTQKYASPDEKNARLMTAFLDVLRRMQRHETFDRSMPAVLAAHINVRGAAVGTALFRIAEQDDVLFDASEFNDTFAYVALGHVHRPQAIGKHANVRYSGSIERMDLGESGDQKSVVLIDVGPSGLLAEPRLLPLESTPIYEIEVRHPATDLPALKERYPDAHNDLVNFHITYTAGQDSLEEVLRELDALFPRWYARDWNETTTLGATLTIGADETHRNKSFEVTVREYVERELTNHPEAERAELLARLEALFREETE